MKIKNSNTLRIFGTLLLSLFFIFSITSCAVVIKTDSGKHKGWYKNKHNPPAYHSPKHEKSKGKSKK
jgi:hypothetical protein